MHDQRPNAQNKSAMKGGTMPNSCPSDLPRVAKVYIRTQELAEELQKPITRKFKNCKVYLCFQDTIWEAYLADIQLVGKYVKGFHFSYVLLIFIVNMCGFSFESHKMPYFY